MALALSDPMPIEQRYDLPTTTLVRMPDLSREDTFLLMFGYVRPSRRDMLFMLSMRVMSL